MRFTFEPSEMTGPGRVEVTVHQSVAVMREWAASNGDTIEPTAVAYTTDFPPEHDPNVQMHFGADQLHISLIAHECTHAALALHHQFRSSTVDIPTHSEDIPEWTGNLTAMVYYSLISEDYTMNADDDE